MMKDHLFLSGLIMIAISFFSSFLLYFIIISIPLYGLAVFLIWSSRQSRVRKLLVSLLPLILWWPIFSLFMSH